MNYSCFHGLVGFRFDDRYEIPRTANPQSSTDYLYTSSSGLWVNDLASNLINLENIKLAAREHEDIEQYLQNLMHASISEVLQGFETFRAGQTQSRRLLSSNSNRPAIKGAGSYNHKVSKSGRFVGLEIKTKPYNTVALSVNRIAFQFDSVQVDLPIYLYRSDTYDPVVSFNLNNNKVNTVSWFDASEFDDETALFDNEGNLYLNNTNGETYYLGYYEDDVTGYAIKYNHNWKPCGCVGDPFTTYNSYLSVKGISVDSADHEAGQKLFNIEKVRYEENNFGLNITPFVECNNYSLYCAQKKQFASAIQHKAAIKVLESIWSSTSPNQMTMTDAKDNAGRMAAEIKDGLIGIYEGGKLIRPGIMHQINIDFSMLDPVCLKSRSKWGVANLIR